MSGRYKAKPKQYDVNEAPITEYDLNMMEDEEGSKYYNADGTRKSQDELERDGLIKIPGQTRNPLGQVNYD